ncbi:MAG TPA: hydroxysqualene dehydroxylase HpnE [Gammaproteobacteria bacterium]
MNWRARRALPVVSPMNTDKPVVVIGGGLAGLSSAVALADVGVPVRLFEGAKDFGGRAQSCVDTVTGETVDIGPHVLTNDHRNMLALLERLGTAENICWQPERFITLVDDGKAVRMRNYRMPAPLHFLPNFFHVEKLSLADVWSARRVLWHVMQMNEDGVLAIDDRVAEDILREMGVSEAFIDWFWRTVCMAIMNVPLEQCSAGALFRFLKMMSGRSDFHFGFPTTGLADLYVPASLDVIASSGGETRCETPVRRIEMENGRVSGVQLEDDERIDAQQCIVAVPPAALAQLFSGEPLQQKIVPGLSAFRPSPYISTYLWFSRKLTRERFWARIWSANNFNYDFYDLSNIRPRAQEGSLIATNCIFSERLASESDETIIEATLRELAEFIPEATRDCLQHARVHRIAMAIVMPKPGFEKRRPATRTSIHGLYLAGDWVRTAVPESMESAVRAGFLAAEAVAADRGIELRRALPLLPMQGVAGWLWRRKHADKKPLSE